LLRVHRGGGGDGGRLRL